MSEPKRWLDQGGSRDVEQLVRAARAERPDSASLRRSLAAVGMGLGATHAAASAKAAGTAASVGGTTKVLTPVMGGLFAKWAALGAVAGTLGVGIAEMASDAPPTVAPSPSLRASSPLRPSRVSPDATPVRAAPTAPSAPAAPAASASAVPLETTANAMTATTSAPRLATPPSDPAESFPTSLESAPATSPSDADTLAAEVKSIDRARSALAAGNAAQALAVLGDYERLFRSRGFAPEALYLRMEACASLGRTAEARAAAQRLIASYPNSLHTARARAVLSKSP